MINQDRLQVSGSSSNQLKLSAHMHQSASSNELRSAGFNQPIATSSNTQQIMFQTNGTVITTTRPGQSAKGMPMVTDYGIQGQALNTLNGISGVGIEPSTVSTPKRVRSASGSAHYQRQSSLTGGQVIVGMFS